MNHPTLHTDHIGFVYGTSLQIVHSLEPLNHITIKHSGVPPIPEHLAEQFAGCSCSAMLDLYVGYDERLIAESLHDYMTFQTPYGALRLVHHGFYPLCHVFPMCIFLLV